MATRLRARPSYRDDFHAWALDQARRIRDVAKLRRNEAIDWDLVAEEIEDMGARDRKACESFVERIIAHLLKLQYAADERPAAHREAELAAFRADLEKDLTRSIENGLRPTLDRRFMMGKRLASAAMRRDDPAFASRLPEDCPYSFEQILGADDWLPGREMD